MRSPVLLTIAAAQAVVALVCEPYVPVDIGWSFNLASGYLSRTDNDTSPNGSEFQLDQRSPFGIDGYGSGDYIFTLLNCTDKALKVASRQTTQCYPPSKKGHRVNTTTLTDFVQIQSNNNVCLTVASPRKDKSIFNYVACNSKPSDLSQLFRFSRTVAYPDGVCSGDPNTGELLGVQFEWEESPYCGKVHHWHLVNDTDTHSRIYLTKNQPADEQYAYFFEAG